MDKKKKILIIQIIIFILVVVIVSMVYNHIVNNKIDKDIKEKEENIVEVLKLGSSNFEEEVLNSDKPVVVDFYADWCGPCKMMSPVIDSIAQEVDTVKVGKINVDDNQDLAAKYNVMSIPTIIIFKDGKVYKKFVGVTRKDDIINEL